MESKPISPKERAACKRGAERGITHNVACVVIHRLQRSLKNRHLLLLPLLLRLLLLLLLLPLLLLLLLLLVVVAFMYSLRVFVVAAERVRVQLIGHVRNNM